MRWVLYFPLVVVLGLFALSNMQEVELRLWPLDVVWVAPLGTAVLSFGALAFLLGATLVWTTGLAHRRRANQAATAARVLEGELAETRRRTATAPQADLARLAKPGHA